MQSQKFKDLDILHKPGTSDLGIVLLHGYGANQHDLAPLAKALDPQGLHNWYFPNGILPLALSPFFDARAWVEFDLPAYEKAIRQNRYSEYMAEIADRILPASQILCEWGQHLAKTHARLYWGGFSQGAMLALDVALELALPQIQKVLFLSGGLTSEQRWRTALQTKTMPFEVFQSHGRSDPILPFSEAQKVYEMLRKAGVKATFHDFEGGHTIPNDILIKLSSFLNLVNSV